MLPLSTSVDFEALNAATCKVPARNVPRELWSMIFFYCLPIHPSYNDKPAEEALRDPRLAPLTLASVCREWRYIACDTAGLWETCWVNFRHPELNTIWLGRAGTGLLNLYGRRHRRSSWGKFDWKPIMLSILPFQRRWRSVELEIDNFATLGFIPEFDTPALEIFRVPTGSELPFWMTGMLPSSPKLRELRLDWFSPSSLANTRFPALSRLEVGWTAPRDIQLILSTLTQLQHLDVYIEQDDDFPHLSTVTHTNLISLRLNGEFTMPFILDHLILPSLRTIHILWSFEPSSFLNFIHRSKCQLTEFYLGCYDLGNESVIQTLQDSSISRYLEKLTLGGIGRRFTRHLFDSLLYTEDTRIIPHLTQLCFEDCSFGDIPDGLVADVVISRCSRQLPCECHDCSAGMISRNVQLVQISIDYLDKDTRSLDIARLVPLPEEKAATEMDELVILDLVSLDRSSSGNVVGSMGSRSARFWIYSRDVKGLR